ncbi:hypothetical protein ZWY2020_042621 [Hordeum vulgare]|nr:hypothetical protein ZWY2020_042621 [Hordeum vulgare]
MSIEWMDAGPRAAHPVRGDLALPAVVVRGALVSAGLTDPVLRLLRGAVPDLHRHGGRQVGAPPVRGGAVRRQQSEESRRKQSFFTWFFGAINLGIFVAGTLVSWLQQNVSWALGFGVSALCLLLASAGFLAGTPWYRVQLPAGSPLRDILRVVVASVKKRKARLPAAADRGDLGLHEVAEDDDLQKLAHTKGLRCLDKAAAKSGGDGHEGPWSLCTVSEVEAVKILARMVPIWVTCVLYAASLGQMTTTFIQQGMTMDNRLVGRVKVPVASMVSIEVVFMLVWVLLHAVIMPLARRWGRAGSARLSQLQRMGVGRVLVVLAMATAALVESRRLRVAGAGRKMGIAWQVPQFVLVAGSDVFCGIAQLEFFYGEAPASMRSICSAFSFLALSLGFYVNSVVVTAVAALRPGWLAPNLNEGTSTTTSGCGPSSAPATCCSTCCLPPGTRQTSPPPPPPPS